MSTVNNEHYFNSEFLKQILLFAYLNAQVPIYTFTFSLLNFNGHYIKKTY